MDLNLLTPVQEKAVNQVVHCAETTSGAASLNYPDRGHMHRPWNLHSIYLP